jgi:drug/metabolite transporter (DMT)-like permease
MSAQPETHHLRHQAVVQLILTTAAWGISFPVFKMLLAVQQAAAPEATSFFLAACAILIRGVGAAGFFLLLRPRLLSQLTRKEWRQGTLLGLFGGAGLVLQLDALNHTQASISAFLTQFYCVLLPLWFCLRRREWPALRLLLATLLVVGGITLLSGLVKIGEGGRLFVDGLSMGRGEWETLLAAVFFTVQILLLERPAWRANRVIPVSVLMFFGFAACALPVVLLAAPSWENVTRIYQTPQEFALIGTIILVCTVYAYTAMNRWQPHVSSTEAGLIYCLEPVFTAIYVLFLPAWLAAWTGVPYANETLTDAILYGGGLITLANVLLQIPQRRKRTPVPAASLPSA